MSTRKEIVSSFYGQNDEDKRPDFYLSDENFQALAQWYLAFSEKRELLGNTNHLLYICRKKP